MSTYGCLLIRVEGALILSLLVTGISGATISELNSIASDPDSKFVIFLARFTDFPGLVDDIATAT
jgi:cobalamin biosynthesis protein CbiG